MKRLSQLPSIGSKQLRVLSPLLAVLLAACSGPPMSTTPDECVNALTQEEVAQGGLPFDYKSNFNQQRGH
jgi:hypothetical protein